MFFTCFNNNNDDTIDPELECKDEEKDIEFIINENTKLKDENEILKQKLNATINKVNNDIDDFVENWYEKHNEDIDIGVIKFGFFKIDIFPDYLEKSIYKKFMKIIYSYLLDTIDKKN